MSRHISGQSRYVALAAKLKALLRKAAERTYDKLWLAIGQIMDQFRPDECRDYFNNSGYVSNQENSDQIRQTNR